MKSIFLAACVPMLLLIYIKVAGTADVTLINYCPDQEGCPFGLGTPETKGSIECFYIQVVLRASRSACLPFYRDALEFTDINHVVYGYGTTKHQVCDYYTPEDTVDDCLYPNGTLEINFCAAFFALAYQFRNTCSRDYTIDSCKIPYLGQLALNRFADPTNNCSPGPVIKSCQLEPSPGSPECPNCIVSSCTNI